MSVESAPKHRLPRQFSAVSDRQISQAAFRGRRVTFKYFGTQPAHEVTGYIVGMDDYHWLLATVVGDPGDGEDLLAVSLVHKSRADLIHLHAQSTLDSEPEAAAAALARMGDAFWSLCKTIYGPTPRSA